MLAPWASTSAPSTRERPALASSCSMLQGAIVAVAQKEHQQIYPQPGWVEHSPLEIARNTEEVIAAALQTAKLTARDLVAVGITNQRETTVVWDRSGRPLHNALVWQDTRVDPLVAFYSAQGGKDRFRATHRAAARQLLQRPETQVAARQRRRRARTRGSGRADVRHDRQLGAVEPDRRLERRPAYHRRDQREPHAAHAPGFARLGRRAAAARSRSRAALLPRIASSSEVYGEIATGPLRGVPIAGILGDQQAALVGQTCFRPGEAKNTYGTGCFLLMNTGTQAGRHRRPGSITTVAYQLGTQPAHYALEGSIAIAGALVQWLRDNLGHHREEQRRRRARGERRGQRRRLHRARVLRPLRAVLEGLTRAASSPGSRATRRARTSHGPRSKRRRIRRAMCSPRWSRTPASS